MSPRRAESLSKGKKLPALLCDEPIASLYPASAQVVMELIRDICRRRTIACIVNLHQVDAALKYADRIIGMFEGEIVYDGPTAELTGPVIERIYNKPMSELMISAERPGEQ